MRVLEKIAVATAFVFATAAPAAARWVCVPEIDGSAGVSALAMLAAASLIAYQRRG